MHDIHEANRIAQIILERLKENNLSKLKSIDIELGSVVEHGEDISPENLDFNLRMILKENVTKSTKINITKVKGESWELVSIDAE